MSRNEFQSYGVTTAVLAGGASTILGLSAGPSVIDMVITAVGGTLYISGGTFAVSGSLIATGALLTNTPMSIGTGNFQFAGLGTAYIMKKLSDGFAGSSFIPY
jgi:hypothetical protein